MLPRTGPRCAGWLLLLAVLSIATGCSDSAGPLGNGERPQRELYGAPPQASTASQAPPAVAPPLPADASASIPGQQPPGLPQIVGDPNAVPGDPSAGPGGPPAPGGNPLMAIPGMNRFMRPNYGKWKPEDFQRAKARRDPQLIEALVEISPNRASSDKFALLLIDLLTKKIDDTQPFDPAAAPGGVPSAPPPTGGFAPTDERHPETPPAGGRFGEKSGGLSAGKAAPGSGFGMRLGGDAPPAGVQPGGAPPGLPPFGAQPGDPNAVPSGPFTDEQLAGGAIGALGANRRPTARNALKQIVQGQLATIVPDAASTSLALQAILLRPSPDEEELLLAAATTPAKVRAAPKPDGMAATELQTQAIAAIDARAVAAVQARMIKRVIASKTSADERRPLLDVLVKAAPASVAGQVDLFVTLAKDDPLRKTLEHNFALYSATAIDQLFRLPPDAVPPPPGAGELPARSQQPGFNGLPGGEREPGLRTLDGKGGGRFGQQPGFGQGAGLGQQPSPPQQPDPTQQAGQGPASGQAPQALDDVELRLIVQHLWTDRVVKTLEQEAVGLEGHAEKFADPLLLCINMPVHSTRTLLDKLQREWWREGTDNLPLGQRWGDLIRDPALLIVVKRTPRKEDPAVRDARLGRTSPAAGAPGAAAAGGRRPNPRGINPQGGGGEAQSREEKARYQWMTASEELVQSLNARFFAAAKAAAPAADSPDLVPRFKPSAAATRGNAAPARGAAVVTHEKTAGNATASDKSATVGADKSAADKTAANNYDPSKLPFALHEGATVVAEYHLNWPADVQAKLKAASVTPLVVHYVRIEQQGSLPKLLLHYQKQLRGATSRLLANGRWLDYNGVGAAVGQARSADVMITRGGAGPAAGDAVKADAVEELVVEILSIEVPEPKLKAPAT